MTKINRLGLMVCAYDRAGIGKSDLPPVGARTTEEILTDLRNLLQAAEIPGPYIYVGHSMSGMTGMLYGARYPEEIAGLVLVDPSHPDIHTKTLELLPDESANESESVRAIRYRHTVAYKTATNNGLTSPPTIEWWDFDTSAAQIKEAGGLGDLPLVVLMRDITATEAQAEFNQMFGYGALDYEWAIKLDTLWEQLMIDVASMSTNSALVVAEGSSHMIPDENSQSVVDAVSLLLEMIGPLASTSGLPVTAAAVDSIADVAYIDDGNEHHTATIYTPQDSEGPFPTVAFYHGGMFYYDEAEFMVYYEDIAEFFASFGIATVVPRYRPSQTDPYPAAHEDAFCSLAWLHSVAGDYNLDTTRLAVLGLDAGGDIAAMIGVYDDPSRYLSSCPYPWPEVPAQGIVSIGGYYQYDKIYTEGLHAGTEMFQSYLTYYYGAEPEQDPELFEEVSVVSHIDGDEKPFLVLYNFNTDFFLYLNISTMFADELAQAGVTVEAMNIGSDRILLYPASDQGVALLEEQPSLAEYGMPEAAAWLVDLFDDSEQ